MICPFFPAFRARFGGGRPRARQKVRQATLHQLQEYLSDFLPPGLLAPEEEGPNSRDRVFGLRLTFECFVWQVLNPATACREVVRQVQALFRLQDRGEVAEGDSAYVQARIRLPRERWEKALVSTAQAADRKLGGGGWLRGRPVKVVDGSSTQLADTEDNQERYPQPSTQKEGCGFPVMRFAALFSLVSGAILNVAFGDLHGHDVRLLQSLWECLKKGDILLGDRAFGDFPTLAAALARGVDVVARVQGARKVDYRRGRRLGRDDALFVWNKPLKSSAVLSQGEWDLLPPILTVRVVRFQATLRGFRGRTVRLVTTLLDAADYPAAELIALYARRWRLELCFRDLKTTMGMEQLRCKGPDMAEKELLAYLVAHNLVRCLMAAAATEHEVATEQMSFKGSVDALRQYSAAIGRARNQKMRRQLWDDLLRNIAKDKVPRRPGRNEPRAVKRRPKPYALLTRHRRAFRDIPHRSRARAAK